MAFSPVRAVSLVSTNGQQLRNQSLYERLVMACRRGVLAGSVKVQNAGQPATGRYAPDPANLQRKRLVLSDHGETFMVCCPGCNDTRNRLYINHMWGVRDSVTQSSNLGLLKCFNEDCPKRVTNFSTDLRDKLDYDSLMMTKTVSAGPSSMMPAIDDGSISAGTPIGMTRRLVDLPPTHKANEAVRSWGLDPQLLSETFELSYCVSSTIKQAVDRLVVPIDFNGVRVGWQARYLGGKKDACCTNPMCRATLTDVPPGADKCRVCLTGNLHKPVKWLTSAGLKIGRVLFNYDHARTYPYVVIVEGPKDVMAMGHPDLGPGHRGPVVCTFGHTIGQHQLALLSHLQQGGTVYVMYDGDVQQHTLEQVSNLSGYFPGGFVYVPLERDQDPADLLGGAWSLVRSAGIAAGAKELPVGRYVQA